MHPFLKKILTLLCCAGLASTAALGQPARKAEPGRAKLDVSELKTVPDGNYLVTLEMSGQPQRLNIKVQGNNAKCVRSSDPGLKDIEGSFQARGSGTFLIVVHGGSFRGTQVWIFRSDGAAAIREVPDRGEQQSAVSVTGDSIELPKEKKGS